MKKHKADPTGSSAAGDGLHVSNHDINLPRFSVSQDVINRLKHPKSYDQYSSPDEMQCTQSYKFHENNKFVEPLAGFLRKQEEIAEIVWKPYHYIPDVVDPPYETPRKERFLKERPLKIMVNVTGKVLTEETSVNSTVSEAPVFDCQLDLINRLRANPDIGFFYMKYAVDRSSKYFHPYALRVCEFKDVDKLYMTIGPTGVTQYSPEEMTFTPTEMWEEAYKIYLLLTKIKTFKTYLKWKTFYAWRKSVIYRRAKQALNNLRKKLFACDPVKRQAMLEINGMCSIFLYTSLVDTNKDQKIPLFYFVEIQFAKLEKIMERLHEFRDLTINILSNACLSSLMKAGFTPDDSNVTIEQTIGWKSGGRIKIPKDGKFKMSFIEQARKREICARLAGFIQLFDYYQLFTLQNTLRNTYAEIVDIVQKQIDTFPLEILKKNSKIKSTKPLPEEKEKRESFEVENEAITVYEEKEEELFPYFDVDLVISLRDNIKLDPSETIIRRVLTALQSEWENHICQINPLLTDPAFYSFTRPLIDGKYENPLCGKPPKLQEAIEEDDIINMCKKKFWKLLELNFNANKHFIHKKFNHILNYYREDMAFDESQIYSNERIDLFRQWCERYKNEEDELNELPDYVPIGVFHINLKRFKKDALPAPNNKQKILAEVLPSLGKEKVLALMKEAATAIDFLNVDPVTTDDYVAYIKFVDAAQKKIEEMEVQLDYVKELYDIIEEYHIEVDKEEMANYMGISVYFTSLRLSVDKCLEERTKLITKFNTRINKDINLLIDKIQVIDEEVSQPWLLEPDSTVESVMEVLNDLNGRLAECTNMANDYRSHQKTFKVEMTRFEILDQVINKVKLYILLWNSLTQFDVTEAEWYELEFNSLDVEEVTNFVQKNIKSIQTLEKGLPHNEVLPLLKDKVELMKEKLPMISHLRNPNLRLRHWVKIESLLKHKFKPDEEPVNLRLFEKLGAFSYPNELAEIASAASSEAGLELMLNKVDEAWKTLDFQINKHKDQKDVFILGSLEDVQATLDDSNITIQTVAASRHVAPVKPRVDDWIKRLDLFAKTLDAWQYCQMQWLYLEAIFSAPDIIRQLPVEAKLFTAVDKSWKDIMRKAAKMPLALENCIQPGVYEQLVENNTNLDIIMKCLESYLETKCMAFPRFFFLSNDELLEILAQTRNPHAVQRHLQKCFDAIFRLEFDISTQKSGTSNDIIAMISPEGERVAFTKGLKARGNVEDWLGKVEAAMFSSLKKNMIEAIAEWYKNGRRYVIYNFPSQIVLTVSQIYWAQNVHKILESDNPIIKMKKFEKKCFEDLNKLAAMVRGELPKLIRDVIINIITVDVHARDTISVLVENKITSSESFDWMKALRYYWDMKVENCLAKMSNAVYTYGYEYLGAQRRLVITPLTDKCYLCLMGALQLDLGGAPAGPAGTGKTETTKDLAKALAIQCVVFNCSDGLDYKMMGRFFSGLATSGAWCCFDEFNRIDIEVLSVIAQQLITIRNAKAARAKEFMFEGRKIRLVMSCAAFITMNPGYAGRTELPDNLKALFRPVSMMVPNYQLIAEVTLYSEGFESSKPLSVKMTLMYKLCSEQLSLQDHYDFGMRAVKSVLVMAGSLKRDNPDKKEDVVLLRALRDSNLPKFLADDAELFSGILNDLFPGVEIPEEDYGIFQSTAIEIMKEKNLQPEACSIKKIIELHETMVVRHGVMTVGPTGSGKSTVLHTLKDTYTRLAEKKVSNPYFKKVNMYVLNPKSITIGELYGEVNPASNEWHDGLLGLITRIACADQSDNHQWIVCDGPVDAVWIENLNTVLDDNKMLCLANSERIKFTPYVHMLFEVEDLKQASPATVSRCGMVYLDPIELKWLPRVKTWIAETFKNFPKKDIISALLLEMFEKYVESGLKFFKKHCDHTIAQVDIAKADTMCSIIESLLLEPNAIDHSGDSTKVRTIVTQAFVFAYMWSLGGNVVDESRDVFETYAQEQFEENQDVRLPPSVDLWGIFLNIQDRRMDIWGKLMIPFEYDPKIPFFEILVPTIDTVRMGYIMQKLVEVNKPVLFTGGTGVGKSVIAKLVLNTLEATGTWVPIILNFSAQTSSGRTQEILELKLDKIKKTILGAPIGKRVCVFVDDVNMPKLEVYGAQPPIELLRQILDSRGLYDRDKLFWKKIVDVVMTCACAPPGGGRNPLTPRFMRHFAMLSVPAPTEDSLKSIFRTIVRGFLKDFAQPVVDIGDRIVNATVELYNQIAKDLLPTPEKSHYIFNLRDLSKCIQGILQADSGIIREANHMLRLFYHECLRVFHDRLINVQDKSYFYRLLSGICLNVFSNEVVSLPENEEVIEHPPLLLFGDFLVFGAQKENRFYEEIVDVDKTKAVLHEYLEDYAVSTSKEINLIFFMDAIEHLCRLARILRSERGNGLLVGVGGMGKQSLTKLASHINGYNCFQIEVSRGYDKNSWHEDLRKFYLNPGAFAESATFLFTDTQIVVEEFLEDINNTLNSGEVPNLFEAEELERAIIATRPAAKKAGIEETNRDGIYQFFIGRVRNHLHLMLCMSPVGDQFRRRCRMFPSLVNCCTIDWYSKWPREALLSVAKRSIGEAFPYDEEKVEALSSICVLMHESVEDMTDIFWEEMRRKYYTTPSSYLDLLKLYTSTWRRKAHEIESLKSRIGNGLNKLYQTNEEVAIMKVQLIELAPKLRISSRQVSELMGIVAKQQIEIDKVKAIVAEDENSAKAKAAETATLAAEARKDLEAALPALQEAQEALESLNKNDINEIKVFNKPPRLVQFVMEAVCLLLGEKTEWLAAKSVLGDVRFLDRLINYPIDNISNKLLKKLQEYTTHPDFEPEIVAKQSKVCKSICIWVRAVDGYAQIFRIVEPKREKLERAAAELDYINQVLKEKQEKLAAVEKQARALQDKYDTAVSQLENLQYNMELGETRLNRSGRLTEALADEEVRWVEMMKTFESLIADVPGNTLVAAGGLAYLGAFTNAYRERLLNAWIDRCKEQGIKTANNFSLLTVLADPYEVRKWNSFGLPRDQVSTENAILVTQGGRWPLMIDPQEQANRWIRSMEAHNGLKVVKMTDNNFMRIMEVCIRGGLPILVQEIGETLDPSLEPILLKQTFVQAGRTLIRLGDNDVEYDKNFKLYITTKMANPHYLPEICIKVTIVNFTVTPSGLEEQLLADVVRLEKPELERMRNELIAQINADKAQMKAIEDKILEMLFAEGNILDNEEIIVTLNESKETSAIISTRIVEAEATEVKITTTRELYRSVANRGSVLYFVVANLALIDPMYQFSLKYFNQVIENVIENSEQPAEFQKRLTVLIDEITYSVFKNVSRGLFERHKIVYSFMITVAILLNERKIDLSQWTFLLRGPDQIPQEKKPDYATLTDGMWNGVNYLASHFKKFKSLMNDYLRIITITIDYYTENINILPTNTTKAEQIWDESLSSIEKLMLLKALKEEKLIFGITAFVEKYLGQKYVESPIITLNELFADTSKVTPLVFVLSTGTDPLSAFQKFAADLGFANNYTSISLGQGQGPIAEGLMRRAMETGDWVFLQNCHLATSWMLSLENIVIEISENANSINDTFRLYLSSMPSNAFPVSVLQNSVKVTNEPPKGLKANVKRAFFDLDQNFFENNVLGDNWRRIIFGICFFHAIIQERKKFGPLGWNIVYEFTDSDRDCCLLNLQMFCSDVIPWDALIYTTGEITYGGRITDNWDLRCLKTILESFFSPKTLDKEYTYSLSGTYYAPSYKSLHQYQKFIDNFPIIEDPEIFGMHENANISYQLGESKAVILTILEVQPKSSGGSAEGKSDDEIAYDLADVIMSKIALKIDIDTCNPKHLMRDSAGRLQSLTVVLIHEVERYNILLKKIHSSMENLQKAIKGFVVMSEELENVFRSLVNNQVPEIWHRTNVYPSLKTLGSWIQDLVLRIDFINTWLTDVKPISFWLSGLSFPQGFITGVLQTHARKYNIPIDHLLLDFKITDVFLDQVDIEAAHMERGKEVPTVYKGLKVPDDGVLIHGLFIDAGKWDSNFQILVDASKGEMNPPLPSVQIIPTLALPVNDPRYVAPLYKTSIRAGVLSTTGHSTNFVMPVLLPSVQSQSYWILKGTALLVGITN